MHRPHIKKRYLISSLVLAIIIGLYGFYIHQFEVLPQVAYYLLDPIPEPTNNDVVLVISPHPDDETLGAAGFIKRAKDNSASVKVVIATDGNKHGLKTVRHAETLQAMSILGILPKDIQFFDYPDGNLKKSADDFAKQLGSMIDREKPSIILSTYPADIHPDHRIVGQVVDRIMNEQHIHPTVYQYLIHYHRYPRPEGFHPTSFLLPPVRLISVASPWQTFTLNLEEQNAKNEAILQYKTQLAMKNPILRGLMLSFARQNELFVIVRP